MMISRNWWKVSGLSTLARRQIRVKFQSSGIFLVIKTSLMQLMKEGPTMSQCLWKKIGLKPLGFGTLVGLNKNKASLTSPSVTSPEIESRM